MRQIWLVVALLSSGCAALLQGREAGYADADLPRFAPMAIGLHEETQYRGAPSITFVSDMTALDPLPGALERGRSRMRMRAENGAWDEVEQVMSIYPDRIEEANGLQGFSEVILHTPLRAGTRWTFPLDEPGQVGTSEIVGIENVCTPAGFFHKALVVKQLHSLRLAPKAPRVHYETTSWLVPDVGTVLSRIKRDGRPPRTSEAWLVTFTSAKGQAPLTFQPCP